MGTLRQKLSAKINARNEADLSAKAGSVGKLTIMKNVGLKGKKTGLKKKK